jgi:hypothetical protein
MNKIIKIPDLESLVWLPDIFKLLRAIQAKLFSANMHSLVFYSTTEVSVKEEIEQLRLAIKETAWREACLLNDEELYELVVKPSFSIMVKK